jgi:hypothetical protein
MLVRFFLRIAPWWVFGLASFWLSPIFGGMVMESIAKYAQIQHMQDAPPPAPMLLHEWGATQASDALDEVAIAGQLVGTMYPIRSGNDKYVVMEIVPSGGSTTPRVAFIVAENEAHNALRALDAATDETGQTILRGFVSRSFADRIQVTSALGLSRTPVVGTLIIVDPFFGERDAALSDAKNTEGIGVAIGLFLLLALNGAMIVKFRALRRGKAHRRKPPVPVAKPMPVVAKGAKQPAKPAQADLFQGKADPFRDGPIITYGREI